MNKKTSEATQLIVNFKINSLWHPAPEKTAGPRLGLERHLCRYRASSWFCFRIYLGANHWCRAKFKLKKDHTAVVTQTHSCQKQRQWCWGVSPSPVSEVSWNSCHPNPASERSRWRLVHSPRSQGRVGGEVRNQQWARAASFQPDSP